MIYRLSCICIALFSSQQAATHAVSSLGSTPVKEMAFTNSDCDVPACESSLEALQASLDYVNKAQQAKGTSTSSSSSSTPTPAAPPPRPLQREALGHFSWSILHSIAANMPERPNGRERKVRRPQLFLQSTPRFARSPPSSLRRLLVTSSIPSPCYILVVTVGRISRSP